MTDIQELFTLPDGRVIKLPISKLGRENMQRYVQAALRTESQIDSIVVNDAFVKNTILLYIQAGQMLDQIKKHAFYGKAYNTENLIKNWETAHDALREIHDATLTDESVAS